jgi:predicted nucleotidyltransferase
MPAEGRDSMTVDKLADLGVEPSDIDAFCRKWDVSELSLFGSALREDFSPSSDVDILVAFDVKAEHGLFDLVRMEDELRRIFGRDVDLVSRRGVEASRNHFRRKSILESAKPIYGRPR